MTFDIEKENYEIFTKNIDNSLIILKEMENYFENIIYNKNSSLIYSTQELKMIENNLFYITEFWNYLNKIMCDYDKIEFDYK